MKRGERERERREQRGKEKRQKREEGRERENGHAHKCRVLFPVDVAFAFPRFLAPSVGSFKAASRATGHCRGDPSFASFGPLADFERVGHTNPKSAFSRSSLKTAYRKA
jgi:hypothetical protein